MKKTMTITFLLVWFVMDITKCSKPPLCPKESEVIIANLLKGNFMVKINNNILGDEMNENPKITLPKGIYPLEILDIQKRVVRRDTIEVKPCQTVYYNI
jgi:hypothetical protein